MTHIEIARFRVEPSTQSAPSTPWLQDAPYDQSVAILRSLLVHAMRSLNEASKCEFQLLQDLQDPTYIYYIGRWSSVDAYSRFKNSEGRQELVRALESFRAVMQWRELYEIVHHKHWLGSLLSSQLHSRHEVKTANVIGIARHNVAPEDVDEFRRRLDDGRIQEEQFSGYRTVVGRKSKSDFEQGTSTALCTQHQDLIREEFVVLSGWSSKQHYDEFPTSEKYVKYAQIRDWTKWFERRIALVIPLH